MTASDSVTLGPSFAPEDPTLPKPWAGLIDGSTGILYYWNPETNVTQYEKPTAQTAGPPLPISLPPSGPSAIFTVSQNGPFQSSQQVSMQHGQQMPHSVTQQPQPVLLNQHSSFHLTNQQIQHTHVPFPDMQMQNPHGEQFQQQAQQFPQQLQQVSYMQAMQLQGQPNPAQSEQQLLGTQFQNPQGQLGSHLQGQEQQPPQQRGQVPQGSQISYQQGMQLQGTLIPDPSEQQLQGPQFQNQHGQLGSHLQSQEQQPPQQRGQVPQGPQISYQQGRQLQGTPIPDPSEQQMQGSQFQNQLGLQSASTQVMHQKGQLLSSPQVASHPQGHQLGYQHGQHAGLIRSDDTGPKNIIDSGYNSPSIHQSGIISSRHPLSSESSHVQGPYPGPQQVHSDQHLNGLSSRSTQKAGHSSSLQQEVPNMIHRQQTVGSAAVTNQTSHIISGPSMALKTGYEDEAVRSRDDLYSFQNVAGPMLPLQQPKLSAIPVGLNLHDARAGTLVTPVRPPGHSGGQTMIPSYSMSSAYPRPSFPIMASVGPPSRMSGPQDYPNTTAVDAYRKHHEVTTMGSNVPPPFITFEETGFPAEILREMHCAGFVSPTPIQAQTWPVALQNRDIVAIAKTGSGKTLGYLIPAFIHLRLRRNNPQIGPTVLVLAPTRELATQILDEALKFGRSSRISCTCLYGGAPKGPQLKELDRGVDIVVATPGRLNDILEMGKINLRQILLLVLDEADRMLDMGFEPQIRRIVNETPPCKQTLMFTATWPKEVRKIAADLLVNPVQVNIGGIDELAANKAITQYVEVVQQMDKQNRLEKILRSQEHGSKTIIFCSTKRQCDHLARGIGRVFGAVAIHGDKSQDERDRVLNNFRTGRSTVLVATDVAARGLDIKDIRVVINFDFPTGIEDYVHRIGRTGRAGATGLSYTFFSDQDWKHAADLIKVLEGANQRVPLELQEMAARGGSLYQRGGEHGGMGRLESSRGRFDSGVGRDMMSGAGGRGMPRDGGWRGMGRDGGGRGMMMRDGRGVRGMRDGNRGMFRDGPGGNFGERGRSDFGGRGGRGRGFRGAGGRNRSDHGGPNDRYHPDGRMGRYENRRPMEDRSRENNYSRSPERNRPRGYDRSRNGSRGLSNSRSRSRSRSHGRRDSRSRSRSYSRSWSRSRSRSRSRSFSRSISPSDDNRRPERPRRVSGFDVAPIPEAPKESIAVVAPPVSGSGPGYEGQVIQQLPNSCPALGPGHEGQIIQQLPNIFPAPGTGYEGQIIQQLQNNCPVLPVGEQLSEHANT